MSPPSTTTTDPSGRTREGAPTRSATRPPVRHTLPRWAPGAAFAGAGAVVAGVLVPTGFGVWGFALGTAVVGTAALCAWSRAVEGGRKVADRLATVLVASAFLVALVPLVSLLYTVVSRGLARLDPKLFTFSMQGVIGAGGGVYHAIVGTLVITGLAAAISIPVGVLAGIYLVEYGGGRLARALTFFVDVMTGIPSIVAGLFVYALFVLLFGPGIQLGIMGAIALSVLMIPIVVRSTEEMLALVPDELREASLALGVPKWRTIVRVVLPTAAAGIVTGVLLAVARIIGETAPLLVTAGLVASTNFNPLSGQMATLSVFSYIEYTNPGIPNQPFVDRAWAAALLLIVVVMGLNLLARLVAHRFAPTYGSS